MIKHIKETIELVTVGAVTKSVSYNFDNAASIIAKVIATDDGGNAAAFTVSKNATTVNVAGTVLSQNDIGGTADITVTQGAGVVSINAVGTVGVEITWHIDYDIIFDIS